MANLYELTGEYTALLMALESAETDEQREAIWQDMDTIEFDITDKAEAYARIIRNCKADVDAYKAEIDRLSQRKKTAEGIVQRLENRLLDSMETLDVGEIHTSIGKWKLQLNPWSCQITDEAQVPEEYRIPQPDKIDRAAMLRHFKETGECLPGADFVRSKSVRFR